MRALRCLALSIVFGACVGSIEDPNARPIDPRVGRPELGPQPLHRLNRLEYDNTIRELAGTTLRPADTFPPDGESNGFDNMAAALQLTPTLLDRYYSAAREVLDEALDDRPSYAFTYRPAEVGTGGYPVGELWRLLGNTFEVTVEVPEGGATVTLIAGGVVVTTAPSPIVRFELDGVEVETFGVRGSAAAVEPHVHMLSLTAGPHTLRYVPTNFINDAPANISNDVLVLSLEVRANEIVRGPGRSTVYVCDPISEGETCYREIIATFATRAYRRPLTRDEESSLVALFEDLRTSGEPDDQALRLVLRAVMTSPKFLYRVRTTGDANTGEWLDPYVLASRLSYFLWSSMPDERLFAMAASGELTTEEGLASAVEWMLADERVRHGLLDGFVEQWLSTRRLPNAAPSLDLFPTFDSNLRAAMAEESKLFFADFLANEEPASALLDADFGYLNDRLAEHYGVPAIGSAELVRVEGDGPRDSIVSLSAWLAVEADADHGSPIKRGRWLSDRILCEEVPSPPAGLAVEPVVLGGEVSVRAALEQHRSDPVCATCHSLLDVLGMGFEEFDAIGRRVTTPELDTLGELPDGSTFEGAAEFSRVVDTERFVGCVTDRLFAYSVGRPSERRDDRALLEIAEIAVREGYTLPDVIRAIVLTPAFRSPAALEGGTTP
jgi:hypothetical protein